MSDTFGPALSARKDSRRASRTTGQGSEGKTCTCGEGPWDLRGRCETCGGFDLGEPYIDPPSGITLQQQLDGSVKAWLP